MKYYETEVEPLVGLKCLLYCLGYLSHVEALCRSHLKWATWDVIMFKTRIALSTNTIDVLFKYTKFSYECTNNTLKI